jgi:uncharacterized membrane protein
MSRQTKQIGGWGLVVVLVGSVLSLVVPVLWVVVLAGWVLALIGYFRASEEYREPAIKTNTLIALVLTVAYWVVLVLSGGFMMVGAMRGMMGEDHAGMAMGGGLLALVLAWILSMAAGWFWYKANRLMTDRSGLNLFKIGGLLIFIGTVLTPVLIGGILISVGLVVLIVAWFTVQEEAGQTEPSPS